MAFSSMFVAAVLVEVLNMFRSSVWMILVMTKGRGFGGSLNYVHGGSFEGSLDYVQVINLDVSGQKTGQQLGCQS